MKKQNKRKEEKIIKKTPENPLLTQSPPISLSSLSSFTPSPLFLAKLSTTTDQPNQISPIH
jgi:hypothetical protein